MKMDRDKFKAETWDKRNTLGVIRYDGTVVAGWSRDEVTDQVHVACGNGSKEWRGIGLGVVIKQAISDMCEGRMD